MGFVFFFWLCVCLSIGYILGVELLSHKHIFGFSSTKHFGAIMVSHFRERIMFLLCTQRITFLFLSSYSSIYLYSYMCYSFAWSLFSFPRFNKVGESKLQFSSAQSLSCVRLLATPWIAAGQASVSITNSQSLLKLGPSSRCWHPAISSSVIPFSSCPQSLPASGSFPMSQLFAWGGWSIGVSASAAVLPMNTQDWSPLGWTGWISLQSKGTFKSLLQHYSSKTPIFQCSAFLTVQLSHPYMTTGKTIALTRQTFVGKVISLLFNMLSKLVITFLSRSKCLLISWL